MRKVSGVKYLSKYRLQILFNDGEIKEVNFDKLVDKGGYYFGPLNDIEFFKKVSLDEFNYTICWPNGAELSPDVLYEMGIEVKRGSKNLSTKRRGKPSHSIMGKPGADVLAKSK
jgi:hypothetical protein